MTHTGKEPGQTPGRYIRGSAAMLKAKRQTATFVKEISANVWANDKDEEQL